MSHAVAGTTSASSCIALRPRVGLKATLTRPVAQQKLHRLSRRTTRCMAMANQETAFREAQQRWANSIKDGDVRTINATAAGKLLKEEGWTMLDVRPENEVERAGVDGAINVPLFTPETRLTPEAIIKNMTTFSVGGWWQGGGHMNPNPNFMSEVQAKIPKDAKIIVACQKGLRSLAATEGLKKAGYGEVAWINGGFDSAKKGDLPVSNNKYGDIRYGSVGGLSGILGWTTPQRDNEGPGFFGGPQNLIFVAAAVLVIDVGLFVFEGATGQFDALIAAVTK